MLGKNLIARLILCCAFLMAFTGCSHLRNRLNEPVEKPEKVCVQEMRVEDYPKEIIRQVDIVENSQESDARVDAYLQQARLHSSVENPKRDIRKAIYHLEKYLSFDPQANVQYKAKKWLVELQELDRFSKKVQRLKREKKALGDAVEKLKKVNLDLNNKIEKLKDLEIRHERKKRSYK